MSFGTVAAMFPEKRFEMHPWGNRRAIVVDLDTSYLRQKRDSIRVLGILSKHIGADGTLTLSTLSEEDQSALMAAVSKFMPIADAAKFKTGTVGLQPSTTVSLEGPGGKVKGAYLRASTQEDEDRNATLRSRPVTGFYGPEHKREDVSRAVWENAEANFSDSVSMHAFGYASFHMTAGMKECTAIIEKIEQRLATEHSLASRALGEQLKLGIKGLVRENAFSALSPDIKSKVESEFIGQWKLNGFKSLEEAESFLQGVGNARFKTSLSLSFSMGRSNGAGTYFSFPIGSFEGGPP